MRASGGQSVYAELRRQIQGLEIAPGTRLYEPELAARLQVSRTPLREATRLLLAEGLLQQLPTGGMVVPPLSVRDIDELYRVRAALESIQAADATARVTGADLADLDDLVERNALLVGHAEEAMRAGHALHARIAGVADHGWATRLHGLVDGQMARYRTLTNDTRERREAALAEHRALVAAIRSGDADAAAAVARDHVLHAREAALRALAARDLTGRADGTGG